MLIFHFCHGNNGSIVTNQCKHIGMRITTYPEIKPKTKQAEKMSPRMRHVILAQRTLIYIYIYPIASMYGIFTLHLP